MSNSVKIQKEQVDKIEKLLNDKDLNYRSRNDFVVKAVETEIKLATFKNRLSPSGKYYFDMLYNAKLIEVVEKTNLWDDQPGNKAYEETQELRKNIKKKDNKK